MSELQNAEKELYELTKKVTTLRRDSTPTPVKNYSFQTLGGEVSLLELFGDKDTLALVSKDNPQAQRTFANSRNWRFKMASHLGGDYIKEQTVMAGETNTPGIVCYIRKGEEIFRKNSSIFGPGDEYCPQWNILSLAGVSSEEWTPQFNYWARPVKMDDGGQNLN